MKNTFSILKPGGKFRSVVPDLEYAAREYINSLERGNKLASLDFCGKNTLLSIERRHRGVKGICGLFSK